MPSAQDPWPTLDELLREEGELELAGLSESDAYELGMRAVAAAREQRLPIAVGVWRAGRQLFHCGLPGSTQDNDAWLRRKGRVVMRFEHSSLYMARLCQDKQVTLTQRYALPASRYAAAGGAVPLRVRGTGVVGWFGVSGLPQLEDHRFVVDVLRTMPR
ncbi:heme-degrading domain-containing protein [Micromonospora sp. GCM10011542]|uniref:heme-degrading domain-containing protein n=1 Tax=Micromonospora sp. GCM10011542 TaxID=3317337 RepID=UPI003607D0F3